MALGYNRKSSQFLQNSYHAARRFPIALLTMAALTLALLIMPDERLKGAFGNALIGLVIGAGVCVIITLAREVTGRSRLYIKPAIAVIAITALFWFSDALRFNIAMAAGAVLLILGNAASWKQARNDLHIWDFNRKLWIRTALIMIGIFIVLYSLAYIQQRSKIIDGNYFTSFIIMLLFPVFLGWLMAIPSVDSPHDSLHETSDLTVKVIGSLATWVLAPVSLISTVVVLLYGAKVLITMELLKGEIAVWALGSLILGTLTWLVLEPPFIQKSVAARGFRRLWFPLSIAAAVLLLISIAIRIEAYGYTDARFAIVLAAIWALGLGIWFTIKKKETRDIRLISGFGAALLLFGAFTAGPLSIKSQENRVVSLIAALELVDDSGKITPITAPNIAQTTQLHHLSGALYYLYRHEAKSSLNRIFPNHDMRSKQKETFKALGLDKLFSYGLKKRPLLYIEERVLEKDKK